MSERPKREEPQQAAGYRITATRRGILEMRQAINSPEWYKDDDQAALTCWLLTRPEFRPVPPARPPESQDPAAARAYYDAVDQREARLDAEVVMELDEDERAAIRDCLLHWIKAKKLVLSPHIAPVLRDLGIGKARG